MTPQLREAISAVLETAGDAVELLQVGSDSDDPGVFVVATTLSVQLAELRKAFDNEPWSSQ